jgi:hypothetical protein
MFDAGNLLVVGGIGFAEMNSSFNANAGIYGDAVNREEELVRCAAWRELYHNALAAANLFETMQTVTAVAGVALVVFCYISNMGVELVITDRRVYGKAFPGKRVDIPVDSVSSVGKGFLNTICVASSSGKIMFTFLQDNETAFEEVNKLLVTRQETVIAEKTDKVVNNIPLSAADEIRKFNQLYQEGIISKEEFDQKKKELLGV